MVGKADWLKAAVLRLRNRYYLLLDVVLLPLAAYLAFVIRLDRFDLGTYWSTAIALMGVSVFVKVGVFLKTRGYSRYWPFASVNEVVEIVLAACVGEVIAVAVTLVLVYELRLSPPPRSIPVLDLLLTIVVFATPRLTARWLYTRLSQHKHGHNRSPRKRVLIVGAGEGGALVLREIKRNPQLGIYPVGFVDDDPMKHNLRIQDTPVLGAVPEIPQLVSTYRVDQILIAIPTAGSHQMRRIVDVCRQAKVEVLTLPGVFELIAGRVGIQRFRPVRVEDLLVRDTVHLDATRVRAFLAGEVILVTGAGGSIGSELCRQIALCGPAEIILLGHGENSIYAIHRELRQHYPTLALYPVIADVRDVARLDQVFAQYRPKIVFHAAAHKHVPLMEENPEEAVLNNIGGTQNLLRVAELYAVNTLVMISTDKAVNPTSMMGLTKRVSEHLVRDAAKRTGRRFVVVRFGNVLGSRGSVVPLFQKQIEAGGPVTVTHPDVERYFMTIPEAVQLVLQTAVLGVGGETFVLDMGKPIKIVELAREMIRLAGREGQVDIVFTGLRPGEKLYEELFLPDEHYVRTAYEKIFVSQNGALTHTDLEARVAALLETARAGHRQELYRKIADIVPECSLSFTEHTQAEAVL